MQDVFSKTSFDELLKSLVEIETGNSAMEQVLSDGRGDTFPGFDSSAPQVMAMAQQEVAAHQALYAQIAQQQQRLETLAQGLDGSLRFRQQQVAMQAPMQAPMQASLQQLHPQHQAALLAASASAPTSPVYHQQRAASPPLPQCPPMARPTTNSLRLSLDGGPAGLSLSGAGASGAAGGPMFSNPNMGTASGYTSPGDPAYLSDRSDLSERQPRTSADAFLRAKPTQPLTTKSDSESMPSPFPRASLKGLGVMSAHGDDLLSGGIDVHSTNGSERRREKNRIAQRRFRERQKTTVAILQTELDQKEVDMQRMASQLRILEQTNQALTTKLLQYEKTYGILPG